MQWREGDLGGGGGGGASFGYRLRVQKSYVSKAAGHFGKALAQGLISPNATRAGEVRDRR